MIGKAPWYNFPTELGIPPLKRARDYRLYDVRGGRYVDMYLLGGLALLGHRPPGVSKEMKNVISRGILGEYPSLFSFRVEKAVRRLIPGEYEVRFFSNLRSGMARTAQFLGADLRDAGCIDPVISPPPPGEMNILLWRPFFSENHHFSNSILFPLVPFPMISGPGVFCFPPGTEPPASETVSPVLLAGFLRALHSLLSLNESSDREGVYNEEYWARFDAPLWTRKGPYLIMKKESGDYGAVRRRFLDGGVLLPPVFPGPAIVPGGCSEGEIQKILTLGGK